MLLKRVSGLYMSFIGCLPLEYLVAQFKHIYLQTNIIIYLQYRHINK